MSDLTGLAAEPWRFDFFDVLRNLEFDKPDKPRIGDSGARDEELVILGQDPYVEFPASNLSRFDLDRLGRYRILCRHLGLLGPQGALPLHTTALPSGVKRGTRKHVRPSATCARVRKASDMGAEQNHLWPVR